MEGEMNEEEEEEEEESRGVRFKPPTGFKDVLPKPTTDFYSDIITPSTQLWLFQCPLHQALDLENGKQISLKFNGDGVLGSFQGSSGKSYDIVSFPSKNSNATVFLPSADGQPKIVGKISRHVSIVHYPEPSELQKQKEKSENHKQRSGKSMTNSSHQMAARTQSSKPRSSKTTSSKHRSSLFDAKETPKPKKRKHVQEKSKLTGQSTLDSARDHIAGTSSGFLQHSTEKKSKKNKKA